MEQLIDVKEMEEKVEGTVSDRGIKDIHYVRRMCLVLNQFQDVP